MMTQDDSKGQWGGSRPGAGNPEFKPKWKSGKTTVIRVPEAIANEVLAVARQIDEGSAVTLSSDSVTTENERLRQQIKECQEKLENSPVTQSSASLKEEIRRLGAELNLVNQIRDTAQSKYNTAVEDNSRLLRHVREARAEIDQLQQSPSDLPDLEKIRDRILLSHPPKERRKLKTVLDQFIRQCASKATAGE